MKILIISPGCAPDQSGFALRVFHWMQMIKGKAEIYYLSTDQKRDPGIADHFICKAFKENWLSKIKRVMTYYRTDFSGHFNFQPDLVQIHSPYFFGLWRLFPRTPVILVEHNVNWNLLKYDILSGPTLRHLPFQFPLVPWLHWRAKRHEKNILKVADHIFVCSTVDKKEILKELPGLSSKITVIPNCLDLSGYTPSPKRGEAVLFMGSLKYSANRDAVEIICKHLAPPLPDIPFQILGDGPTPKSYPPNVTFLGHVPDIKPYLENCRLFIVPLRFGSGTRWKILEALGLQRPVLSTTKGAEGLEIQPGKNILIEDSWPLFVKAIQTLWKDRHLSANIAKQGRRLVEEKYDCRRYTSQVLGIYEKLKVQPDGGEKSCPKSPAKYALF